MPEFFGQQEFYITNSTSMILIHIRSTSLTQTNEIIDFLISDDLILEPIVSEKVYLRKKNQFGTFENETQFLAIAKTRALLFGKIEYLLKQKYQENCPDLYSVPIVNMDWEKAENLQKVERKS